MVWGVVVNYYFLIASLISLFGTGVHIFVGNKKIDNMVFATDLDINIRTISRVVWHSVTCVLAISFAFLFFGAFKGLSNDAAYFIAAYMLGFGALFVYFCAHHLGNPFRFPHPIVFFIMGSLVLLGSFNHV